MLPLKRVLCPIDFSEPSLSAVQTAAELSLYFRARLYCLHVVVPPHSLVVASESAGLTSMPIQPPDETPALLRRAEIQLSETLHDRLDHQVDLALRVAFGQPAPCILQASEELDSDLIVIASHGRRGWRRLFHGSVADQVMRRADRPVLVVRPGRAELEGVVSEQAETARV